MQWNEEKEVFMFREMAGKGIFDYKSGSRERGNLWQEIAYNLNNYEGFSVTARAIRDRFTSVMKKYKSISRIKM